MTNWYLRGLGIVLIAILVAFVPLTSALATTTTGLDADDPTPETESESRISTNVRYARSAYVWPFASGPSYGGADASRQDFFLAHSGGFNLQRPLGIPQQLRTTYAGSALELAEPRVMSDPRRAFAENPRRRVELDLVHDAVGPMYGHVADPAEEAKSADQQVVVSKVTRMHRPQPVPL